MNIKIKQSSNFRPNKSFLGVAGFFLVSVFIQTTFFIVNPGTAYAAPKDDARKKACELGVSYRDKCEEWFDKGYAEAKRIKNTDQKFVCPKVEDPNPEESSILKGCFEGVNFYRAEQGTSVPEGSDIKKDTVATAGATEACKSEPNNTYKELCEDAFKDAMDGKSKADTCGNARPQEAKEACEKGHTKGRQTVAPSSAGEDEDQVDCDMKLSSILSWIACPVIDMGVNTTDYIFEKIIKPMLEDVPVSTHPDDGSYKAWSNFRLIANLLLVVSLLAIVYSQAKGGK